MVATDVNDPKLMFGPAKVVVPLSRWFTPKPLRSIGALPPIHAPELCEIVPPERTSVPEFARIVPEFTRGTLPSPIEPAPPFTLMVPPLFSRLVPPLEKKLVGVDRFSTAPARLLNVPPFIASEPPLKLTVEELLS